jgi:hypothetical protein
VEALPRSSLLLGGPLLLALLGVFVAFLYAVFVGTWMPFAWALGVCLALFGIIKLVALARLDPERQILVSAMLWEAFGGMTGWAWLVLGFASFVLFIWALFFGGSWRDFFICLVASSVSKWLTGYSETAREGALFQQILAQQGMGRAEARRAWIAEAQRRLAARRQSP